MATYRSASKLLAVLTALAAVLLLLVVTASPASTHAAPLHRMRGSMRATPAQVHAFSLYQANSTTNSTLRASSTATAPLAASSSFTPATPVICSLVSSTFLVCTNVLDGVTLNVSVCAVTNLGWFAFGWRTSADAGMDGASAIVGWRNTNGAISFVGNFDLGNHLIQNYASTALQAANLTVRIDSALRTCLGFRRPLTISPTSPHNVVIGQTMNLIFAMGILPADSEAASIGSHTARAGGQLVLAGNTPAAVTLPSSSVAPVDVAPPPTTISAVVCTLSSADTYEICTNILDSNTLNISVCADTSIGWVGAGWRIIDPESGMDGASAIVGWRSADGTISYVGNVDLGDHLIGAYDTSTLRATNLKVWLDASSRTCIGFRRPFLVNVSSPYNLAVGTPMYMLFASGPLPGDSASRSITQHLGRLTEVVPLISVDRGTGANGGSGGATTTCTVIDGRFSLCVPRSKDGQYFNVSFCGNVGGGWLGLGFQSDSRRNSMSGAYVVLGWSDGGANSKVGMFRNNGYQPEPSTSLQVENPSVTFDVATATTCLYFARPVVPSTDAFDVAVTIAGTMNIVFAYGALPSSPADSPSGHTLRAAASFNVNALPAATTSTSTSSSVRLTHAMFMMLSFGACFPLAILCPLLLKRIGPMWFHLHRALVLAGIVLAMIGFIIAVKEFENGHANAKSPGHRVIGFVVIAVMLLQPLTGFVRPDAPAKGEEPTPKRRVWLWIHRLLGYSVSALSILNIVVGAANYDDVSATFLVPFAIALIVGLGSFYVLYSRAEPESIDTRGKAHSPSVAYATTPVHSLQHKEPAPMPASPSSAGTAVVQMPTLKLRPSGPSNDDAPPVPVLSQTFVSQNSPRDRELGSLRVGSNGTPAGTPRVGNGTPRDGAGTPRDIATIRPMQIRPRTGGPE